MGLKRNLPRVLSLLLLFVMCAGLVSPVSAFAAQQAGTSTSSLHQVTESCLDAYDGSKLAADSSYAVTHEEKTPQKIEGYTYRDYREEIQQIYTHKDLAYIYGYPDRTVRPERFLSRAEAVAIFYRLYDGEYPYSSSAPMTEQTFRDVPADAWYYRELAAMYQIGLVEGDGGGFRPNEPITRAELTALATRFNPEKFGTPSASFNDVSAGAWYYNPVSVAEANGWVNGYADGTFRPDDCITRAETMTVINRTINRSVSLERLKELRVVNPYTDLSENHWAYTQVMEASVRHSGKDWHGLNYNGGVYDIIVEKFVDDSGNELAPAVTSRAQSGGNARDIRNFPPYEHIGHITILTYSYTKGDALPVLTKTPDKSTVRTGDLLYYTIQIRNSEKATGSWEGVVLRDKLPEALEFRDGTVYVEGRSSPCTFAEGTLSVEIGDIEPGAVKTVVFRTSVRPGFDGTRIENVAEATGRNGNAGTVTYSSSAAGTDVGPDGGGGGGVVVEKGSADPSLTKTADRAETEAGGTVTYTVTASNGSSAEYRMENVRITDVIPEGAEYVHGSLLLDGRVSTDAAYQSSSRTLTVPAGDIGAGERKVIEYSVKVDDSACGRTIRNEAVMTCDNCDERKASADVAVLPGTVLPYVEKTADRHEVSIGDKVTYVVTAGNDPAAVSDIRSAVIRDVIPEGLAFEGPVYLGTKAVLYEYDEAARTLTLPVGDLAPGSEVSVRFSVTVEEGSFGQTIQNTAVLSGDSIEPVECTDAGITVEPGRVMPVTSKTADRETAEVGDVIQYTVTVGNGKDAEVPLKNAAVTDVIPAGMDFIFGSQRLSDRCTCYHYDEETRTFSVEIGDLAPGETATVKYLARVTEEGRGQEIRNSAVIKADGMEPAEETAAVTVGKGRTDPYVVKTADQAEHAPGDTVLYRIEVGNGADADYPLENVVLTDVIPEGVSFVYGSQRLSDRCTCYTYVDETRTFSVEIGEIGPGESVTVEYAATVDAGTWSREITNTASVSADGAGPVEDEASIHVVSGTVAPTARKTADKETARVGDLITYRVEIGNGSDAQEPMKNVVFSDRMPEGTEYVFGSQRISDNCTRCTFHDETETLILEAGDIAPGETAEVEFQVRVTPEAYGGQIRNVGHIEGDNMEPMDVPADTPVVIEKGRIIPWASKTVDRDSAGAGDALLYTIEFGNGKDAEDRMRGCVLRDVLDEGLDFTYGSVQMDGRPAEYSWDPVSRTLELGIGDLLPGESRTVTFAAVLNSASFGRDIENSAELSIDPGDPEDPASVTAGPAVTKVNSADLDLSLQKDVRNRNGSGTYSAGDTVTYTITAANGKDAQGAARNAAVTDVLPSQIASVGNVTLNGASAVYSWNSERRILSVEIGDLAPGSSAAVQFDAAVAQNAFGETVRNTAVLTVPGPREGDEQETVKAEAEFDVEDGFVLPGLEKTVSRETASVGDTLTYTLTASNGRSAEAEIRNAVVRDELPEGLIFAGRVLAGGSAVEYAYDTETRVLTVPAGSIAPGGDIRVQFDVIVDTGMYGRTIRNTGILEADNLSKPVKGEKDIEVPMGAAAPSLQKTADRKTAEVGDTIHYLVTCSNSAASPDAARNAAFADILPEGLEYQFGSFRIGEAELACSYDTGTRALSADLGVIAPGESVQVRFAVRVTRDAYGEKILNTASVAFDNADTVEASDLTGGVLIGEGATDPSITKKADRTEASVGDVLTYTVTASNGSTAETAVRNAHMTDVLPAYLDFTGSVTVDGKAAGHVYDPDTRCINVELGDLAPGASAKIVYQAVLNREAYGMIVENSATLTGDNTDPVQDTAAVKAADGTTDLQLKKQVSSKRVEVGDELVYTLTVKNGPAATVNIYDLRVTDRLPAFVTFRNLTIDGAAGQPYTYDDGEIGVNLVDLAPGSERVIRIYTVVNPSAYGKEFTNTAAVTTDNAGTAEDSDRNNVPSDGPGSAGEPVSVGEGSCLVTGTKTADRQAVSVGETVTYTVTVSNSAAATAAYTGVPYDVIPDGLDFQGNVRKDGKATDDYEYDTASRTLYLKFGSLEPGETAVYRFDASVKAEARQETIVNCLMIPDPAPGIDETVIPESVTPTLKDTFPAPRVTKTASAAEVMPGEIFTYRVEVENQDVPGAAAWRDVTFVDTLPEELTLVSDAFISGYQQATFNDQGNRMQCWIGDLAPGEKYLITYSVQVKPLTAGGTVLKNTADLIGSNGSAGDTDSSVTVQGGSSPDPVPLDSQPKAVKTVDKTTVNLAGDRHAVFTIALTNPAENDEVWENVSVRDQLSNAAVVMKDELRIDGNPVSDFEYKGIGGHEYTAYDLTIPVGSIAPGQTKTVTLGVEFGADAEGTAFTNVATANSNNFDPVRASAPTVTFIGSPANNITPGPYHLQIYAGYEMGPNGRFVDLIPYTEDFKDETTGNNYRDLLGVLNPGDAASTLWRSIPRAKRSQILSEAGLNLQEVNSMPRYTSKDGVVTPGWVNAQTTKAMVAVGGLKDEDRNINAYNADPGAFPAGKFDYVPRYLNDDSDEMLFASVSRYQLGQMLNALHIPHGDAAYVGNYTNRNYTPYVSRFAWGQQLLQIFQRDHKPDYTSLISSPQVHEFDDSSVFKAGDIPEIVEMTNHHVFMKDRSGHEYWVEIDARDMEYNVFDES